MAADAATNAASSVRPSDDQLAQIDHPADDHTWHDAPDFSKANLKAQAQNLYKGDARADAQDVVAQATSAAHPTGSSDTNALASSAVRDQQLGTSSGIDTQAGINTGVNAIQQKMDSQVDPETVDAAKETARDKRAEYRARTKQYFSKKMPQERREQTVWRLKVRLLLSVSTTYVLAADESILENGCGMPATP
jgi:hypothetical protein